jgi:molecular chaperone GrpE (heat shock protein)
VRQGAQADAEELLAGQEATLKLLDRAFEKFSIKQLEPAGSVNSTRAARGRADAGSPPPRANTVLQVVQTGL